MESKSQKNSHILGHVVHLLRQNGIEADNKRVADKFRALKKKFSEEHAKCSSTGSEPSNWPYYNQMARMWPDFNRNLENPYDSVPAFNEKLNENPVDFQSDSYEDVEYITDEEEIVIPEETEPVDSIGIEQDDVAEQEGNYQENLQPEQESIRPGRDGRRKTPSAVFRDNLIDEITRANRQAESQMEISNRLQGN